MNPREYYDNIVKSITDADIRKVAREMTYHVGKEHRIPFKALVIKCFEKYTDATERKTREILTQLIVKYRMAVCSLSDTPGRWLAATKEEALESAREDENRIEKLRQRALALRMIDLPTVPLWEREQKSQGVLFVSSEGSNVADYN